jgi:carboxysome shell carbonic anhydrase
MLRYREGRPNLADAPTRYLKAVVYHYSSVDPAHEGCAAHGSDTQKAARFGLDRLNGFREAVENSFCCGASIDLLLIGLDTDTDAIRVHLPDGQGDLSLERYVDALDLFHGTLSMGSGDAVAAIVAALSRSAPGSAAGMQQLVARLIENNISQIVYVKNAHGEHYPDIGHAERFIGAGVGFEEIQLRNLMYFAYLNTVEEATPDTDVGIKIFKGLNVARGLPVPIVVRFDYHSKVPGARERAVERCARVAGALHTRYADLAEKGLLHTLQLVRDCATDAVVEVLACSVNAGVKVGAH